MSNLRARLGLKDGGSLRERLGLKDGGPVRMQEGGDPAEQMFNFNPMAAQAMRQERMRREAEGAKRYKSVMGTTPQDLLRRVEPPPAEMSALPLSKTPTTLDRLARSGLEALGMPKPRAQSVASNVKGAIEMLVPDPERIYREMSEATEERDPAKFALANLEAGLGYMPFAKPVVGAAKAIGATALDAGKVAGREALRPIDQAMFGEGPLATLMTPVAPLQAAPTMIPMLGLPATVAKTTRAAKAVKPVAEIATDIKPKFKAPQDKVLLEAQRNAALPVEQGGLGLPPDNTADMRAAAMNYQDYFHGTERLDRLLEKEALDPRRATSGPMPFGAGETEIASRYATSKRDTSRLAGDEGNVANYFTVSAKDLGSRSKADVPVEKAFYFLPREKQQEIISKMSRIGYENPREATGDIVLHPEGTVGTIVDPKTIDYYMKREAKGNPLTALRIIWHDSGTLFNNEEQLAKVFELAGFPLPISQKNAPWSSAQGVLTGKAKLDRPLITTDTAAIEQQVIPALKQAFAKDRTRKKPYGPDQWAKDVRFTPKEWVDELEKDMIEGKNSYVWTSIPDKVTSELRKLGFDGILDVGGKGGGSEYRVVIPFDTKQVRSRFAAFDPKKKDEPGLLKAKGGRVHVSDNLNTIKYELAMGKKGKRYA